MPTKSCLSKLERPCRPRWDESVKTCLLFLKQTTCSFSEDHQNKWSFEKKIWLGWSNWVTVFPKMFLGMQFFGNIHFCISELLTFFTISRTEGESGAKRIFPISRGFTALQAILVKGFDSKFWINALQKGAEDRKKERQSLCNPTQILSHVTCSRAFYWQYRQFESEWVKAHSAVQKYNVWMDRKDY